MLEHPPERVDWQRAISIARWLIREGDITSSDDRFLTRNEAHLVCETLVDLASELDPYREALERIVAKDHDLRNPWHEALMIARAALAANPSEEEA